MVPLALALVFRMCVAKVLTIFIVSNVFISSKTIRSPVPCTPYRNLSFALSCCEAAIVDYPSPLIGRLCSLQSSSKAKTIRKRRTGVSIFSMDTLSPIQKQLIAVPAAIREIFDKDHAATRGGQTKMTFILTGRRTGMVRSRAIPPSMSISGA